MLYFVFKNVAAPNIEKVVLDLAVQVDVDSWRTLYLQNWFHYASCTNNGTVLMFLLIWCTKENNFTLKLRHCARLFSLISFIVRSTAASSLLWHWQTAAGCWLVTTATDDDTWQTGLLADGKTSTWLWISWMGARSQSMADLHFSTELPPRRLLNSWRQLGHPLSELSVVLLSSLPWTII